MENCSHFSWPIKDHRNARNMISFTSSRLCAFSASAASTKSFCPIMRFSPRRKAACFQSTKQNLSKEAHTKLYLHEYCKLLHTYDLEKIWKKSKDDPIIKLQFQI
jgi:hypothetical protein